MAYTSEQRKTAYKKLPPEVQDLIMSNETTDLITNTLKEIGLNEDQENLADSEILYAMYCLQSLNDTIKNIAKLSGKSINDLFGLTSTLQDEIFSKYKIDVDDFIASNKPSAEIPKTKDEIKAELIQRREGVIGEQKVPTTVPEIAPEIHPVIEEGEVAHEVPHVEQTVPQPIPQSTPTPIPEPIQEISAQDTEQSASIEEKVIAGGDPMVDLTTEKKEEPEALPEDRRYPGGADPYREPV